jgi:hypothetical protein
MSKTSIALFILAAVLIGASQSLFIVDQREQAIVLQLGQPIGNPKILPPMQKAPAFISKSRLVQEVRYFDRRILSVDPPPEQVVIASSSLQHYSLTPAQKAEASSQTPGLPAAETAPDATPEPQTPVEALKSRMSAASLSSPTHSPAIKSSRRCNS